MSTTEIFRFESFPVSGSVKVSTISAYGERRFGVGFSGKLNVWPKAVISKVGVGSWTLRFGGTSEPRKDAIARLFCCK